MVRPYANLIGVKMVLRPYVSCVVTLLLFCQYVRHGKRCAVALPFDVVLARLL
jgi:hypothetical protein